MESSVDVLCVGLDNKKILFCNITPSLQTVYNLYLWLQIRRCNSFCFWCIESEHGSRGWMACLRTSRTGWFSQLFWCGWHVMKLSDLRPSHLVNLLASSSDGPFTFLETCGIFLVLPCPCEVHSGCGLSTRFHTSTAHGFLGIGMWTCVPCILHRPLLVLTQGKHLYGGMCLWNDCRSQDVKTSGLKRKTVDQWSEETWHHV